MKLNKGIIRPGTVLEILENGIIKASAPGLFSFADDPSKMPPIMPWFIGSNSNVFSKLKQYDDVWIINFEDNPQQLYWFRKDKLQDNENIPMNETNVEIICNRDIDGEWATIYFSDGSGWVISKGESIITIRPQGNIVLSTGMPNRSIDINGQCISIGSEGQSAHNAAYGDELEELLMSLCIMLQDVGIKAMANPYTMALGTSIFAKLPTVMSKIPNISSQHVTID